MVEFSQGLLAGFQFVDNLRDRAQRRELQGRRITLAEAANARADRQFQQSSRLAESAEGRAQAAAGRQAQTFELGLEDRERALERQEGINVSNSLLAQAQRVGVENLEPHQIAELEDLARFNPNIANVLGQFRDDQRDVSALVGLRGIGRQAAQSIAPQPQQAPPSPSDQVTQSPGTGNLTSPEGVVSPDGTPLPGPVTDEVVRPTRFVVERLLGQRIPDELVAGAPGDPATAPVPLPAAFFQELTNAGNLPVVEQEQVLKRLREEITGVPQRIDFERQQAALADTDVDAWQAFVDPEDRGGSALRELAVSNPSLTTKKLFQEWNTIKDRDPNLTTQLSKEMQPVVEATLIESSTALSQLPVGDNGLVDLSTPEARTAKRNFEQAIALQQEMSDTWTGEFEAKIRAGSMPVGNANLSQELAQDLAATPRPGEMSQPGAKQANMTLAQRATASITGGNARTLSTRQVQSLAWLAKRGYITPGGFEQFLSTGSFTDAGDVEFMDHDPNKILWRRGANGELEVVYQPPSLSGVTTAQDQFDSGALDFIDNYFVGGTDEETRMAKRWRNEFISTLASNPEALGMRGISSSDLTKLTPQHLATLIPRYISLRRTESEYEDGFWNSLLGREFEDAVDSEGNPIDITNFDDIAAEFDIETEPLPEPRGDVRGFRAALATSADPVERQMSRLMSDQELQNAISEARAAQQNPQ